MIVDYHMHLRGHDQSIPHTLGAVEPFVETARARGVHESASPSTSTTSARRGRSGVPYQTERCVSDLDAYVEAVLEAKRRGLPVKLGLEVDWWPPHNERLAEILAPYPWDYLLGSVHWVDGLAVDCEPGVWAECTVEEAWRRYFHELGEAAQSSLFDVLSHPDLAKIFGLRPEPHVVEELHAGLADSAARAGVAIEVSTAGLHKRVARCTRTRRCCAPFASAASPSRRPPTRTCPRTSAATSAPR